MDAELKDEEGPFTGKIEGKLALTSLVKDFQVFLKLDELDLKSNNEQTQAQFAFPLMMVEGFKKQWIALDLPEIRQAIEMNSKTFTLPASISAGTKAEYFLNPTSTTYEKQPAWKVDLNEEVIKAEAKSLLTQLYDEMMPAELMTGEEHKELLAQKEETLKEITAVIDEMKFENVDAYFVIYPETVKFVFKNLDLMIKETKIKVSQSVEEKEDKGTFEIFAPESEDKIGFNYTVEEKGKGKFAFTVEIQLPEVPLFKLEGNLAYDASAERFTLKPDVKAAVEGVVVQLQGAYDVMKIASHTFMTPENAKGLQEMFGGMFGAEAMELTDNIEATETPEVVEVPAA